MANSGIYAITNTVNGNRYIGSSANISRRWSEHKRLLSKNMHHSGHLQNAWNKYGADSFEFSVVEYCEIDQLLDREQFCIDSEKPAYNVCLIAGSCLGVKHTETARANMSEAQKGNTKALGCKRSEETLIKMREARKSRLPISEETRHRMSEAQKGNTNTLGHTNMLGHKHTEETKLKMSEVQMGHITTEETRRKIGESKKGNTNCLGRKLTEETRRKIGEAGKGRVASDETRRKMSEAKFKYWADRKAKEAQMQTQLETN